MCLCVVCFRSGKSISNHQSPIQSGHQMFSEHYEGLKKKLLYIIVIILTVSLLSFSVVYCYVLKFLFHQYHDHVSLNCIQKSPAK